MELAESIGLKDKVMFMGNIPHKEIYRYFLGCDIFSIATDFEGFCIPVIEAMAAGKPIVASDIPAIREILNGGGLLVENSIDSFQKAFEGLIQDRHLSAELGNKARERARIFDSVVMEERERSIYDDLIKL
jgi:glycosyltransferase involved in cell wall biosynthesis